MESMPRPRPLHLHHEKTRHGAWVWYVRVGKGPRRRLRAAYGTPEFQEEYERARDGESARAKPKVRTGSLQWLYERYREVGAWTSLSPATRRQRENIFAHVMETAGAKTAGSIAAKHIAAGIDARSETPAQARHFVDAMQGLFRWALKAGHVRADPTAGADPPKRTNTDGFPIWTGEDIARYEACWSIGTKERVWLDVLLYTGLRRGDAVRLGRQHMKAGVATIITEKTGITVTIPILPPLAATLAAGPTGDLAFICGVSGKPFAKESFGNEFRKACRAAGVNKSAHGLRKAGATTAAENGATVAELEAIFGWSGGGMAALYTRAADRVRLAKGAMNKMSRTPDEQAIPAPDEKVRDTGQKT